MSRIRPSSTIVISMNAGGSVFFHVISEMTLIEYTAPKPAVPVFTSKAQKVRWARR